MDTKTRRKALGWSRAELADRAGLDPRVIQLAELDQWEEEAALARIAEVLDRAEAGDLGVRLRPVKAEQGVAQFGDQPAGEVAGGEKPLPEA